MNITKGRMFIFENVRDGDTASSLSRRIHFTYYYIYKTLQSLEKLGFITTKKFGTRRVFKLTPKYKTCLKKVKEYKKKRQEMEEIFSTKDNKNICSLCKKEIGQECNNCGGEWRKNESIFCDEGIHYHIWCFDKQANRAKVFKGDNK